VITIVKKIKSLALVGLIAITGLRATENVPSTPVNTNNSASTEVFAEFTKGNFQPVMYFEAPSKGGDPIMSTYNPINNKLNVLIFGCTTPSSYVVKVDNPSDYEKLEVNRFKEFIRPESKTLVKDFRCRGSREAFFGFVAEEVLNALNLVPFKKYKGLPFGDPYKQGIPSNWVFNSADQLKSLVVYLKKEFSSNNIQPLTRKPLLVVEVLDKTQQIDNESLAFLKNFYTLLDASNPVVAKFFTEAQKMIRKAHLRTKDSAPIAQDACEAVFLDVEKKCNDFDMKKLAITTGIIIIACAVLANFDDITNFLKAIFPRPFKNLNWNGWMPALKKEKKESVEQKLDKIIENTKKEVK